MEAAIDMVLEQLLTTLPEEIRIWAKYATVEECFAIRIGTDEFLMYLLRRPCTVRTDQWPWEGVDRMPGSKS